MAEQREQMASPDAEPVADGALAQKIKDWTPDQMMHVFKVGAR